MQPDLAKASATPPGADVPLEPELQAFIGRQLQATHDEVLNEPVPDRFLELLRQLEGDPSGSSLPRHAADGANPSGKATKQ